MTRRELLVAFAAAPTLDLTTLPNYCSHEHWGSIDSIGSKPGIFTADFERGAVPSRKTTLNDLIFDPYAKGWYQGDKELERHRLTGIYQCTRRGILFLHGHDINRLTPAVREALDARIGEAYSKPFAWYRNAMKRAHFSGLIRPVHPEFYVRAATPESAAEEMQFTKTVMRIDPLLDPRRHESLGETAGVDAGDARGWRALIGSLFDIAAKGGAVGTKQLQAYRRPLDFPVRSDAEVKFRGPWSDAELRIFQDWVFHECSKQNETRGWPHQVHVGTNNLAESSPLPLGSPARRYPKMKIVMIHCWPFLDEAGYVAKIYSNIYIDTCWQPILSPRFFRDAMQRWLQYVPFNKITCGHDATTVEMAVGSSLYTREILRETLLEAGRGSGLTTAELSAAAARMLHGNAAEIYRV